MKRSIIHAVVCICWLVLSTGCGPKTGQRIPATMAIVTPEDNVPQTIPNNNPAQTQPDTGSTPDAESDWPDTEAEYWELIEKEFEMMTQEVKNMRDAHNDLNERLASLPSDVPIYIFAATISDCQPWDMGQSEDVYQCTAQNEMSSLYPQVIFFSEEKLPIGRLVFFYRYANEKELLYVK